MAIDGSSTFEEVRQAYFDNLGYDDGAGSVEMARTFRSACRALLVFLPEETSKGSTRARMGMNVQQIAAALTAVTGWLSANDTAYRTRRVPSRPDFRNFRGGVACE